MGQVHLLHDDGDHGGGGEEEKVEDEADGEGEGEHESREAAGSPSGKRMVAFFHKKGRNSFPFPPVGIQRMGIDEKPMIKRLF
jgi:hypothetical protein